jgi:hypothetical protein
MSNTKKGTCHCGAVEFELELRNGLEGIKRCDCSLCRRKGSIMASVPIENLVVIKGKEHLSIYQWKTKIAEHYFCKICGIYTHHKKRSNPEEFAFNIACVEGVNPNYFKQVPVVESP